MAKMRHWKQHWDPNADLIFTKKLRIGDDPERPYVLPGDPVTPELRESLGLHRLKIWWEAEFLAIAPEHAPKPYVKQSARKPAPKAKSKSAKRRHKSSKKSKNG